MALKSPPQATSFHSLIVWTRGHNQSLEHKVLPHWPQVLLYETCIYLHTAAPWSLPCSLLPACQGLSNALSIDLWAIDKTRPDGGCDGASQSAFVQPCHVYSCGKRNINLCATVLSFLAITQFRSWLLKIALVLHIWAYENIKKKILHIITFITRGGVFKPVIFFQRKGGSGFRHINKHLLITPNIANIYFQRPHLKGLNSS